MDVITNPKEIREAAKAFLTLPAESMKSAVHSDDDCDAWDVVRYLAGESEYDELCVFTSEVIIRWSDGGQILRHGLNG